MAHLKGCCNINDEVRDNLARISGLSVLEQEGLELDSPSIVVLLVAAEQGDIVSTASCQMPEALYPMPLAPESSLLAG